jgi:hypothetical protein
MTTLGRFDWDILLEKDPANPPKKRESPSSVIDVDEGEELVELEETVVLPTPTRVKVQPEIKLPQEPRKNNQANEVQQPSLQTYSTNNGGQAGILQGNLTPHGILNAFVLSELLNKPKGLQYRYRPKRY